MTATIRRYVEGLWRRPKESRRTAAANFVGSRALVRFSVLRDPEKLAEASGLVLAVARPITGAQTDSLILQWADGDAFSISLATIFSLEELPR